MGTSNWHNIPWCVEAIMKIEPKRVLDIGVGFGRWGMVLREFGELWFGRMNPAQWSIRVEGIEAFSPNILPHHEHFYDVVHVGDASEVFPSLPGEWDLVIFGDVLEHFEKEDGKRLLSLAVERSDYVLVNIPLGEDWRQGETYENPYEEHKAVWNLADFDSTLICRHQEFLDFLARPFASVVLSREDHCGLRAGTFGNERQGEVRPERPGPTGSDRELVDAVRDQVDALRAVRNSRAWRFICALRSSWIWWLASRLRRSRGSRIEVLVDELRSDAEVRVQRIDSGFSTLLWDLLGQRGDWRSALDQSAAYGRALVARGTGARLRWFSFGESQRIRLQTGPGAGRCRVRVNGEDHFLNLGALPAGSVSFDCDTGTATNASQVVVGAPVVLSARASTFAPPEQEVLDTLAESPSRSLAICVPGWTGVRNATQTLVPAMITYPENPSSEDREAVLRLIEKAECENVVFSGGALNHLELCGPLRRRVPNTRLKLLWHGSFLQVREEYAWRSMHAAFQLAKSGALDGIGFVKEGMAESARDFGLPGHFVMNYVPDIPEAPSQAAEGGPHFGLWIVNEGWRKVPYAMAAAVQRIPGGVLHYNGRHVRLRQFGKLIGSVHHHHGDALFGPEDLQKWMRLMHLNLYVTLSECCPLLPLESLSVGTPCLLGPNSHLFRDDPFLFDRLVVPFPDSEAAIHEKIEQALAERTEIVEAYRKWAPGYNERAKKSVTAFLEA